MLGDNTNKIMWIAITVGVVATVGSGALILFPDAMDSGKVMVVNKIDAFVGNDKDVEDDTIFTWIYSGDEATVKGLVAGNKDSNITIPKFRVYNGHTYKVTHIRFAAFMATGDSGNIKSVKFPDSLESIDSRAFYNQSLTSVSIPDSVKYIEADAFRKNQISSLQLSSNLSSVGENAFIDNKLKVVDIPLGTKYSENSFDKTTVINQK